MFKNSILSIILLSSVACTQQHSRNPNEIRMKPICQKNWEYCEKSFNQGDQALMFCQGRSNKDCTFSDWIVLCAKDLKVCQSQ